MPDAGYDADTDETIFTGWEGLRPTLADDDSCGDRLSSLDTGDSQGGRTSSSGSSAGGLAFRGSIVSTNAPHPSAPGSARSWSSTPPGSASSVVAHATLPAQSAEEKDQQKTRGHAASESWAGLAHPPLNGETSESSAGPASCATTAKFVMSPTSSTPNIIEIREPTQACATRLPPTICSNQGSRGDVRPGRHQEGPTLQDTGRSSSEQQVHLPIKCEPHLPPRTTPSS